MELGGQSVPGIQAHGALRYPGGSFAYSSGGIFRHRGHGLLVVVDGSRAFHRHQQRDLLSGIQQAGEIRALRASRLRDLAGVPSIVFDSSASVFRVFMPVLQSSRIPRC